MTGPEATRGARRRRIAIYGKGGAGKSTVASHLSFLFAREGLRTIQVGCDPKADSCQLHLDDERPRAVIAEFPWSSTGDPEVVRSFIVRGRTGVDCLEAGGPEPGKGCAGIGINMVLKLFHQSACRDEYDVVVYDVLGDVVCGGFSVPLRSGYAREVYIVASCDVSSLYAANNIARAVVNNAASGARLAGIVLNRARTDAAVGPDTVARFAERIGCRVAGVVPFDGRVTDAEARGRTVIEAFPGSDIAAAYEALHGAIAADDAGGMAPPTPLSNDDLLRMVRGR